MPNVSVFMQSADMPDRMALSAFTDACTDLCTGTLSAALDKVHIIVVPVAFAGRGHKAYIEIKYRLETFRPPEVMNEFIQSLDSVAHEHLGCRTRIRCFGYGPEAIYGLN